MGNTLTIRLEDRDREVLEAAAREHGKGLSGFIRELAEAEAHRLRDQEVRDGLSRVAKYIASHPGAAEEVDMWGTPDWGVLDGK